MTVDNEMLEVLANEHDVSQINVYAQSELYDEVADLIKTLSIDEQEIIQKRFVEEKALPEIAEELGLPIGTIKSRLSRTISKIKEKLGTNYKNIAYN